MPVFEKNGRKVLFIHVPKTAGSSVIELFVSHGYEVSYFSDQALELFRGLCSPQHIHGSLIQDEFSLSDFAYIFSVFRDPVERLISEYKWRCGKLRERHENFECWTRDVFQRYEENPYTYDNHIRPQHEFFVPNCDVYDFKSVDLLPSYLGKRLKWKERNSLDVVNASSFPFEAGPKCREDIRRFYEADYEWRESNNLLPRKNILAKLKFWS